MTAATVAGASSPELAWHAMAQPLERAARPRRATFNWQDVHENVRRLQARMASRWPLEGPLTATFVKATLAGKRGKVKALQKWPF